MTFNQNAHDNKLNTPTSGVLTNCTGTASGLTSGITNALASVTTTVNISSATAPTSGQILTATSSTAATWQTPSGISVIYNSMAGFLPSSITGTSTTGALTVSTGQAADSTNVAMLSKSSTTSWAVSNGNAINGYSGGTTLPNSSTIHFFICTGGTGTGVFASNSLTPTFPTGYTTYTRRIFSLNTTSAGALIPGTAIEISGGGLLFWLTTALRDINVTNQPASQTLYTLTVPSGIKVQPIYRVNTLQNGVSSPGNTAVIFTSGDETNVAPAATLNLGTGSYDYFNAAPGFDTEQNVASAVSVSSFSSGVRDGLLTTNTSGQIGARSTVSSTMIYWITRGFTDWRRS